MNILEIRNYVNFSKIDKLFLCIVVMPTLSSLVYNFFWAADIYISESKFVVRGLQRQPTSLGLALEGIGILRSENDNYLVKDFLLSRDAQSSLDSNFKLISYYQNNGDFVIRFNKLRSRFYGVKEGFNKYYQNFVVEDFIDPVSGVSTLRTRAFDPITAKKINDFLITRSESLVNVLNEKARSDMVRFASKEAERARKQNEISSSKLANFRSEQGVFDPEKQSAIQLQLVAKLEEELISTQSQLAELEIISPKNSQIILLKKRIALIKGEIDSQKLGVTSGKHSLAFKAKRYDGLSVSQGYTEKQLSSAMAALEQAKIDAERKQLYLQKISQSSLPDGAIEPRRYRNVLVVLIFSFFLFGIIKIMQAGFREHMD